MWGASQAIEPRGPDGAGDELTEILALLDDPQSWRPER